MLLVVRRFQGQYHQPSQPGVRILVEMDFGLSVTGQDNGIMTFEHHPPILALPDNMHSLPVLIQIPHADKSSYGTGIYLNTSNNVFLVTAAHVIFNPTNLSELIGVTGHLKTSQPGSNQNRPL
jgi:hypothetical protein